MLWILWALLSSLAAHFTQAAPTQVRSMLDATAPPFCSSPQGAPLPCGPGRRRPGCSEPGPGVRDRAVASCLQPQVRGEARLDLPRTCMEMIGCGSTGSCHTQARLCCKAPSPCTATSCTQGAPALPCKSPHSLARPLSAEAPLHAHLVGRRSASGVCSEVIGPTPNRGLLRSLCLERRHWAAGG